MNKLLGTVLTSALTISLLAGCGTSTSNKKKVGIIQFMDHTSLNEISPDLADLFVVGFDLAPQMTAYPNKIVLNQLMDMNEITTKLKEVFDKQ